MIQFLSRHFYFIYICQQICQQTIQMALYRCFYYGFLMTDKRHKVKKWVLFSGHSTWRSKLCPHKSLTVKYCKRMTLAYSNVSLIKGIDSQASFQMSGELCLVPLFWVLSCSFRDSAVIIRCNQVLQQLKIVSLTTATIYNFVYTVYKDLSFCLNVFIN